MTRSGPTGMRRVRPIMRRRDLSERRSAREQGFTKTYNVIIDLVWKHLSPTAQAIYPVLQRFGDYRTRVTTVSQRMIGDYARETRSICQSQVSRTIHRDLVKWGLVRIQRYKDPMGGWRTSYYICRGDEVIRHIVSKGLLAQSELRELRKRYGMPQSDDRKENKSTDFEGLADIPETIDELAKGFNHGD